MEVDSNLWWFTSSTISSQHHLGSALPQLTNIDPDLDTCNSLRLYPYTFLQLMKVLKHFLYIQYGSGKQSAVVYSLNQDITAPRQPQPNVLSKSTRP